MAFISRYLRKSEKRAKGSTKGAERVLDNGRKGDNWGASVYNQLRSSWRGVTTPLLKLQARSNHSAISKSD